MPLKLVAPEVASPCINVCKIDPTLGLCLGCWRTIDEIVAWPTADRDRKLVILAAVERRRAEHDPAGESFRGECER